MKKFITSLGLTLALLTQQAFAVPTLFFDGDMSFDASTGALSVDSVLTATQEINPSPELIGSSLTFSALLTGIDTSSTVVTIGLFSGGAGDDISVVDGNANNLLLGEFTSLTMMGRNGRDTGRITGTMNATDGLLESLFGAGQLIALVFNIDTIFNADMFDSSFQGNIDGRIEGESQPVPAPGVLILLAIGLFSLMIRKLRDAHKISIISLLHRS